MDFYSNLTPIPEAKAAYDVFCTTYDIKEAILAMAPFINKPIQGNLVPIEWSKKTGKPTKTKLRLSKDYVWDGEMSRQVAPVFILLCKKLKPYDVLLVRTPKLTVGVMNATRYGTVDILRFFIPKELEQLL